MESNETGVLSKSGKAYFSPTMTARKLYYYGTCAGHFYCEQGYHVKRTEFESVLLMQVLHGVCFLRADGRSWEAGAGDTVIVDCHAPHEYGTNSTLETLWLHFSGLNSREIAAEVIQNNGPVFRVSDKAALLNDLQAAFHSPSCGNLQECEFSLLISRLICAMMHPAREFGKSKSEYESMISSAKSYVQTHLSDSISVVEMADQVHLSASHFSKIFKAETGFSPYEFVLTARLNQAKEYLQNTDLPVASIAYRVGFGSESNFISFFHTNTGMSPKKFRALKF